MRIKDTSINILCQLEELILKLSDKQYTESLECLMDNSVGKHIRHILEFYELMIDGFENGEINYDKRNHDKALENDRDLAIEKINSFKVLLESFDTDRSIDLETSYYLESDKTEVVKSSILRELVYNIEHAIHHMAIIKIGILNSFKKITLDEKFGIAYSTIKYKEKTCAQ